MHIGSDYTAAMCSVALIFRGSPVMSLQVGGPCVVVENDFLIVPSYKTM